MRVSELSEKQDLLVDSLRHIELDLSNTLDEFTHTTGRPPEEFYVWRRKAKWARYYKQREIEAVREQLNASQSRLTNEQMRLIALEAGYDGDNPRLLLRAMYHLTMSLLSETGYQVDEHQMGVIAAVRNATEEPFIGGDVI